MLNLALAVIQEHAPAAQEHASGPLTVEGDLMICNIVVFLMLRVRRLPQRPVLADGAA